VLAPGNPFQPSFNVGELSGLIHKHLVRLERLFTVVNISNKLEQGALTEMEGLVGLTSSFR